MESSHNSGGDGIAPRGTTGAPIIDQDWISSGGANITAVIVASVFRSFPSAAPAAKLPACQSDSIIKENWDRVKKVVGNSVRLEKSISTNEVNPNLSIGEPNERLTSKLVPKFFTAVPFTYDGFDVFNKFATSTK